MGGLWLGTKRLDEWKLDGGGERPDEGGDGWVRGGVGVCESGDEERDEWLQLAVEYREAAVREIQRHAGCFVHFQEAVGCLGGSHLEDDEVEPAEREEEECRQGVLERGHGGRHGGLEYRLLLY